MKHPANHSNTVTAVCAALLIFLFAYTAISKLRGLHAFALVLADSPLLHAIAWPVAVAIPLLELLACLLLMVPQWRLAGLYVSLGLLAGFTGYIAFMLLTASHLPCSCGGVLKELSWKQHLVFNVLFLLICLLGIRAARRRAAAEHTPSQGYAV